MTKNNNTNNEEEKEQGEQPKRKIKTALSVLLAKFFKRKKKKDKDKNDSKQSKTKEKEFLKATDDYAKHATKTTSKALISVELDMIKYYFARNMKLFNNLAISKQVDLGNIKEVQTILKTIANTLNNDQQLKTYFNKKIIELNKKAQNITAQPFEKFYTKATGKELLKKFQLDIINNKQDKKAIARRVQDNIELIKTVTSNHFKTIETATKKIIESNTPPRQIEQTLKNLYFSKGVEDFEQRATFHAYDQAHKHLASVNRLRYEKVGITKYLWVSSGDGKVRSRHQTLDGQVFEFENPPISSDEDQFPQRRNNPGEDYNCRCVAVPIIEQD